MTTHPKTAELNTPITNIHALNRRVQCNRSTASVHLVGLLEFGLKK